MSSNQIFMINMQESVTFPCFYDKLLIFVINSKCRMPYTEATMLECLRHGSGVSVSLRTAIRDTTISGCHVEKVFRFTMYDLNCMPPESYDFRIPSLLIQDTIIGIHVSRIHMNEKIWGDPETFRPSRFMDENNNISKHNKLLAFGGGRRICIGYTMAKATVFAFLVTVLQKYRLQPSPNYPQLSTTSMVGGFGSWPQPYYCKIIPR